MSLIKRIKEAPSFFIFVFIFSIVWIFSLPMIRDYAYKAPLPEENFPLKIGTKITKQIHVPIDAIYAMDLFFIRDRNIDTLRKIIGDMGICVQPKPCSIGDPVTIRWSLKGINNDIDLWADTTAIDASGFSAQIIDRTITKIRIQPGDYNISAEVINSTEALASLSSRLTFHLRSKETESATDGLIWWASIFRFLIAIPLALWSAFKLMKLYFFKNQNSK